MNIFSSNAQKTKKIIILLSAILALLSLKCFSKASPNENLSTLNHGLEFSFSIEELRPYDIYGSWRAKSLKYSFVPAWSNAAFIQIENLSRNSGSSTIASGSVYKDWADKFYTYSFIESLFSGKQ